MTDYVPLVMGNAPIGKIAVDLDTGAFEGTVHPDFAHILRDGVANKLLSVSFMARPEDKRSLRTPEEVQAVEKQHEAIKTYLKEHQ